MFHVKHLCLFFFFLFPVYGFSQAYFKLTDKPFLYDCPPDSTINDWIKAESRGKGLTPEESNFFYWVNFVRKNPISFRDFILMPFISQFPEVGGAESQALVNDLSNTDELSLLRLSSVLTSLSRDHAKDLVYRKGKLTHNSRMGFSFSQRVKSAGILGCAAENLYTGKNDALLALLMLLLDLGLEPPGHRINLLSTTYKSMSVVISTIPSTGQVVLVQNFGCN
jgi:hypothetical protein